MKGTNMKYLTKGIWPLVALALIMLVASTNVALAGGGDGSMSISLGNTANYYIGMDILADTGGIRYTTTLDTIISVPVKMFAWDIGEYEGLSMRAFDNHIYYDSTELLFLEVYSESDVWNPDSIYVTDTLYDGSIKQLQIEGYGDTVDFGLYQWEEIYYIKFQIKCNDYDDIDLDITTDTLNNEMWLTCQSPWEDYDFNYDGNARIMSYWIGTHIDTVETLLGEDTVKVDVFVDSSNYRFCSFRNFIRFDDDNYNFATIERGSDIADWTMMYSSTGDLIDVSCYKFNDYVDLKSEASTLYTLVFTSTADDDNLQSGLCFEDSLYYYFMPYSCLDFWQSIDFYDCQDCDSCGMIIVPEYNFYIEMDLPESALPGDTVTMTIRTKNNFPAGINPTGDIQLLINHDPRLEYDGYDNVHDSVSLTFSETADSLVGINLDQPNGTPGYLPPTDTFITFCELDIIIADTSYDCPESICAEFQSYYDGSRRCRALDTTGNVTCDSSNGKMHFVSDCVNVIPDDVLEAIVKADSVTGYLGAWQPINIAHCFELDSVYVELDYSQTNVCVVDYSSDSNITVNHIDSLDLVKIHGSGLSWAADKDWLASIKWGCDGGGGSKFINVCNSEALDSDSNSADMTEIDGTVSCTAGSSSPPYTWPYPDWCDGEPPRDTGEIQKQIVPDKFTLYQNRPNPFNPLTIISFKLAEPRHVTLDIYNILGQRVEGLVDDYLYPGHYDIEWNAEKCNASSGVYFYRVRAGDYVESKKMLLIK